MTWRNVNNWHWVERDCVQWAKAHLDEILKSDLYAWNLNNIKSADGDAVVIQRKGRILAVYDLSLHISISYKGNEYDVKFDLCSESCGDDANVDVSPAVDSSTKNEIRGLVGELNCHFARDIIECHKDRFNDGKALPVNKVNMPENVFIDKGRHKTDTLDKDFTFDLPIDAEDLIKLISDSDLVNRWSFGSLSKEAECYTLYKGLIRFVPVRIEEGTVYQQWKLSDWHDYANIQFVCEKANFGSRVIVRLSNCPQSTSDDIGQFFEQYYWKPIKQFSGLF